MQAHERKALSQARLEHAIECLSAARSLLETENDKSLLTISSSSPCVRAEAQIENAAYFVASVQAYLKNKDW